MLRNSLWGSVSVALAVYCGVASTPVYGQCTHPLFWNQTESYGTANAPTAIAVGDLNNDTFVDIAVAARFGNAISILLNRGDGTFYPQVSYGVGTHPLALAMGDLNGDLWPDLVVANSAINSMSVLLNNGDGTFAREVEYAGGPEPRAVDMADLDGDGDLDVVVANRLGDGDVALGASGVSIFLNDGDGTLGVHTSYPAGGFPYSVVIDHFDADGDLDVAVTNALTDDISIFAGTGTGGLSPDVQYTVGDGPWSMAVGDFDGDLDTDIVAALRSDDAVGVILNDGNGAFSAPVLYPAGIEPWSVAVGDVNGDGWPDLATANRLGNNASIILNNGDGTFGLQHSYDAGDQPRAVALADLDQDGDLEMIVANYGDNTITIYRNRCSGLPVNDDCANAMMLTGSTAGPFPIDTTLATVEAGELDGQCGSVCGETHSVWFQFTPASNGTVNIGTVGSSYDTVLTAFEGPCDVGNPRELACNDDANLIESRIERLFVVAGVQYLFRVSDHCGGNRWIAQHRLRVHTRVGTAGRAMDDHRPRRLGKRRRPPL